MVAMEKHQRSQIVVFFAIVFSPLPLASHAHHSPNQANAKTISNYLRALAVAADVGAVTKLTGTGRGHGIGSSGALLLVARG